MRIPEDNYQMISAMQDSCEDYVCFSYEGSSEELQVGERHARSITKEDITVDFLRSHIFVHKDALANPQSTIYKASSPTERYSGFPASLDGSIKALGKVMADMQQNRSLDDHAMVFKIMPHKEGQYTFNLS